MKSIHLSTLLLLLPVSVLVSQETHTVDHPGMIASMKARNPSDTRQGEALYNAVCINCHGTPEKVGTLPTALRFWEAPFKNGSDPRSMYRTMTKGFNLMIPQNWMTPEQKYQVIHHIREKFLKEKNPSQYTEITEKYLAGIKPESYPGPKPRVRQLKPYMKMDFGNNMNYTFEIGPGNIAYKAIAVRLDPGPEGVSKGSTWMAYDHDLMRVAAVWKGDRFINWRSIAMDGSHGSHPKIEGDIILQNPKAPGWAKPDSKDFTDPRFLGRDNLPYGPLPRDWVHYKGLYQHGGRVLIDYTVGKRRVLEMPGMLEETHGPIVTRTLRIAAGKEPMILQVATGSGTAQVVDGIASIPTGSVPTASAPRVSPTGQMDLGSSDFTLSAWIKTRQDGSILSKAAPSGKWVENGKTLFVRGGRLTYDVGWVGDVQSKKRVNDNKWHHVAASHSARDGQVQLYVDGAASGSSRIKSKDEANHILRIGYTATDFAAPFKGAIDEVRIYRKRLSDEDIKALSKGDDVKGAAAHWNMDALQDNKHLANSAGKSYSGINAGAGITEGRFGKALDFNGKSQVAIKGIDKGEKQEEKRAEPVKKPQGPVIAGIVTGGPKGTKWDTSANGNLRLNIPASSKETTLKILHWHGDAGEIDSFAKATRKNSDPEDLADFTKGGPARWPLPVVTEGKQSDTDAAYVVDEITMPSVNPWHSWMRLSGFDFFEDGKRAAVCTWHGDVWIVDGIGSKMGKLSWKRIASGLFQPLGVRVIDGVIHVSCRDQICVLRDLNGDEETDHYESLNSDHQVTEHFHEFAMGLQTDDDGNFYYAKSARHAKTALVPHHGTLIKVSKDGSTTEILASGFRAANGVCINPDGSFFVTDQEGHWTPKNRVNWVTKGGFYGNMMGYTDIKDNSDSAMQQPLVWLTNRFNRSPGELLWNTSKKWGPLEGALLDISYGMGRIFVVLNEKVNGQLQGGEYALPIPDFPTGTMRGRFHPGDGQLYVCGMFAWAGNKNGTGGFYRVRHTGKPVCLPTQLEAGKNTLRMQFTDKLDKGSASSPASYSIKTWDLKRTRSYGSKHYNEKKLKLESAKLLADNQTIELQIPDLKPTWGMEIQYELKTADGKTIKNVIHNTIHNLK